MGEKTKEFCKVFFSWVAVMVFFGMFSWLFKHRMHHLDTHMAMKALLVYLAIGTITGAIAGCLAVFTSDDKSADTSTS